MPLGVERASCGLGLLARAFSNIACRSRSLESKPQLLPLISSPGRYDEASAWAERLLREYPAAHPGLRIAAASNAMAGRPEQAHKTVARLRQLDPRAACFQS